MTQPCSSKKVVFFILNAATTSTNPIGTDFTKLNLSQSDEWDKNSFRGQKNVSERKRNVRNTK